MLLSRALTFLSFIWNLWDNRTVWLIPTCNCNLDVISGASGIHALPPRIGSRVNERPASVWWTGFAHIVANRKALGERASVPSLIFVHVFLAYTIHPTSTRLSNNELENTYSEHLNT